MGLKYTISGDDLIVDIQENIENFKKEQKRGRIVGIVLLFFFFIGIIAIIACSVRLNDVKNHPEKYEKMFDNLEDIMVWLF